MVRNNFSSLKLGSKVFGLLFLHITICTNPRKASSPPLRQVTSKSTSTLGQRLQGEWKRVFLKGNHTIDSGMVTTLLNTRADAKTRKDYAEADRAAAQLQSLGVCYDDSQCTWYTRGTAAKPAPVAASIPEKPSAGKKRARQEDPEDDAPSKRALPAARGAAADGAAAPAAKRADKPPGGSGRSSGGDSAGRAAKGAKGGRPAAADGKSGEAGAAAAAAAAESPQGDGKQPRRGRKGVKEGKGAARAAGAGPAGGPKEAGRRKPSSE